MLNYDYENDFLLPDILFYPVLFDCIEAPSAHGDGGRLRRHFEFSRLRRVTVSLGD